jgi:hypothetical protein
MKAASLNELQKELSTLPPKRILEICGRLIRFKKENKELLTYILFESDDEQAYIKSIKEEVDAKFLEINQSNLYFAKKSLRAILRGINKYIRYSGNKQTEVELRIYYCTKLKKSGIKIDKSPVLLNLYNNQLKKVNDTLLKIHEDLQFDYLQELKELS